MVCTIVLLWLMKGWGFERLPHSVKPIWESGCGGLGLRRHNYGDVLLLLNLGRIGGVEIIAW